LSKISESYLKALAEELSSVLSSKSVIGEPIIQEDKVLIPVTKLGFAIGSGSGKNSSKDVGGEGIGGGGGVEPIALIAIYKNIPGPEGVQVLSLQVPSKVPEVIEKAIESFTKMQEKKTQSEKEKEEKPTEQT
jgi:uncharacterized spore protein YtfJ